MIWVIMDVPVLELRGIMVVWLEFWVGVFCVEVWVLWEGFRDEEIGFWEEFGEVEDWGVLL